MNINIQSVKFDADVKLVSFIENKVSKLQKFDDTILSADVTLKLDKDPDHGNKIALITLAVKGDTLVAERKSTTFEEAVDEAVDAIRSQIEKRK